MLLWGGIVVLAIISHSYFQYALKNYETDLWESFGKPSALNSNGFFRSNWYVISGNYFESKSPKFIMACKYHRINVMLTVVGALIVFGVWPATWSA